MVAGTALPERQVLMCCDGNGSPITSTVNPYPTLSAGAIPLKRSPLTGRSPQTCSYRRMDSQAIFNWSLGGVSCYQCRRILDFQHLEDSNIWRGRTSCQNQDRSVYSIHVGERRNIICEKFELYNEVLLQVSISIRIQR